MTDWNPIPFEPNLKFASELSEDLQTKYFQKHEKAKQTLEHFFHSLQNILTEHKQVLTENLELSLMNDKLKQIIKLKPDQPNISTNNNIPSSEVLGSSTNCQFDKYTKRKTKNIINNLSFNQDNAEQKENFNVFVPIFSSDFNSDMEDETLGKYTSPPRISNNLEKVKSSPVLSKRKKFSSKKSNSSISSTSSHSVNSSNDSKINTTNTPNMLEKNINDIEIDINKEFQKEFNEDPEKVIRKKLENEFKKEPLKTIENTFIAASLKYNDNKTVNVLGVSNINFGRTEFVDKGKKMRQSTLTLKKVIPIIDISKVESQESLDNKGNQSKHLAENNSIRHSSETFFDSDNIKKRKHETEEYLDEKKKNQIKKSRTEGVNVSMQDDELIETSPIQNEKSKLRNKLSLKKTEIGNVGRIKIKSTNAINSETLSKFEEKQKSNLKENEIKNTKQNLTDSPNIFKPSTSAVMKGKSLEPQISLSDDTFFSPAELTNKNNVDDYDIDITEFEEEMNCKTSPIKDILMDSYDMVPGRYEKSPEFAYKEGPIRNKNERALLQGWSCRDCEKWYNHLPPEERKKQMDNCSRHRGRHNVNPSTPESFWNPEFEESYNSTCE